MSSRAKSSALVAVTLVGLLATACTSSGETFRPDPSATVAIAIHSSDVPVPGAEAVTSAAADTCRIVSGPAVTHRFGGTVTTETASTSAIGNPLCTFTLRRSNLGHPGVITVTTLAGRRGAYDRARARADHRVDLAGVGNRAFYVARTGTLEILNGQALVVIHAVFRVPGSRSSSPARLKADLTELARALTV
jgi:hypothetical protein